jgi:cytochrome P450
MWVILEIVKDPSLLQAVREDLNTLCTTDPVTRTESINIRKIPSLPLLQSIFVEVLRMRTNFNLMRQVNETIIIDGITLRPGSMLQAPMRVAHYEEAIWGREGHSADDFWAERHITYQPIEGPLTGEINQRRSFAMAGRPTSFFPFGIFFVLLHPSMKN